MQLTESTSSGCNCGNGSFNDSGVNGYPGTLPHRITQVAKSRTGTHESSSKAVHVATCVVPQLRLINAPVISLRLIVYRRVQQWNCMLINSSWGREEESTPMGSRVGITILGDLNTLWITICTKASNPSRGMLCDWMQFIVLFYDLLALAPTGDGCWEPDQSQQLSQSWIQILQTWLENFSSHSMNSSQSRQSFS